MIISISCFQLKHEIHQNIKVNMNNITGGMLQKGNPRKISNLNTDESELSRNVLFYSYFYSGV